MTPNFTLKAEVAPETLKRLSINAIALDNFEKAIKIKVRLNLNLKPSLLKLQPLVQE